MPSRKIDAIKKSEKDGLVVLPEPPRLRPGDPIRVTRGLLTGVLGLYAGQRGHQRVAVLLAALGRVTLPASSIEPAG
jgi:hypothetical protein